MPRSPRRKQATALSYGGSGSPKVVATGRERIAEKIIEVARGAGVPIREDPALAQALAQLDVGHEIPPELYQAVAEALVWALKLERALSQKLNSGARRAMTEP